MTDTESFRPGGVSAVVVMFNSAEHLTGLAAALEASVPSLKGMIAVDNASLDGSAEAAAKAGFSVVHSVSNHGFGAACNLGLQQIDEEFVLFCNPDVMPGPDAVEQLRRTLVEHPKAAIVGGVGARHFSTLPRDIADFLPRRIRSWLLRETASTVPATGPYKCCDVEIVDYARGAFLLCRVSALKAVGGFDEAFFLYAEEEDLARRLTAQGWAILVARGCGVAHSGAASSRLISRQDTVHFRFHSLYQYYRKHRGWKYAQIARLVTAGLVLGDLAARAVVRRRQVYTVQSVIAPFQELGTLRRQFDCDVRRAFELQNDEEEH